MISQAHIERRESMQGYCIYHRPTEFWNGVNAALISHVVILNGYENLIELEARINRPQYDERLFYTADRSAQIVVDGRIEDIRDRGMLKILASTYESLSRELHDPEWNFYTRAHKRRKMLRRNN